MVRQIHSEPVCPSVFLHVRIPVFSFRPTAVSHRLCTQTCRKSPEPSYPLHGMEHHRTASARPEETAGTCSRISTIRIFHLLHSADTDRLRGPGRQRLPLRLRAVVSQESDTDRDSVAISIMGLASKQVAGTCAVFHRCIHDWPRRFSRSACRHDIFRHRSRNGIIRQHILNTRQHNSTHSGMAHFDSPVRYRSNTATVQPDADGGAYLDRTDHDGAHCRGMRGPRM